MAYSNITNKFFYNNIEGKETTEGTIRKEMEAITLLIMHELYVNTNFRRIAPITIKELLESCNYCVNTTNINKFKDILLQLKELNKICFDVDLKEVKKNETIKINTENLMLDGADRYFQIDDEEIEIIKNNVPNKSNKMINTLLVYCYLKARVHKPTSNADTCSVTTYQEFVKIEEFTGVSKAETYINILEELGLISVKRDMMMKDGQGNVRNCANIYLVNCLVDVKDRDKELKEGFKAYKNYYEELGYSFFKAKTEQKNNNLVINGLKGQLKKQENEGRDTTEIEEKLAKAEQNRQQQKKQSNDNNNNNNVIEFSDIRTDKGIPKKKVNPFKKAVKEDIEEPITRVDMFRGASNIMKQKQSKDISKAKIEDITDIDEFEYKRRYIPNF